jgi:outer membrane protein assembly factor BamB
MSSRFSLAFLRSPRNLAWILATLAVLFSLAVLIRLGGRPSELLSIVSSQIHVTIGLAAVGLFALGIGTVSWLRNRGGANLLLALLGAALCGLTVWAVLSYPAVYFQWFASDYFDAEGMARLQKAALAPADKAATSDWPQWRGPNRDGVSEEKDLRLDWTNPPPVLWKRPLGGGYSSLAIADGRVYTQDRQGDAERVICFDAATGQELWTHRYSARYSDLQRGYDRGPRATPTIHDGRVYTVGATGIFLCLEAKPNGPAKVLWQHVLRREFDAALPTWGLAGSPLIEGDSVIVQPGGRRGAIAAFDRRTGDLIWKSLTDPAGYSSPMAATLDGVRHILAFTGKALVGLRPTDGQQLWRYDWPTRFEANIATPVVAGNFVFISSNYDQGCALVEVTADGDRARVKPVYVKRNKLMRNHHDTCVLVNGHLYGFDSGLLKCVDMVSAQEKWVTRDLAKGSVLAVAGHLFVLTEDGSLALVEATPTQYRQKGLLPNLLQGPECWAMPALAGGRLYLRGHHEIVCLDMRK